MIVVDSNVLAYLHLPGSYTSAAEALFERDPDWIAPPLWRSEFRNILAGHLRRGSLGFDEACSLQQEAERQLADSECQVESSKVLQLVRESDCSAYDCEFVALALQLGILLVTMDDKLLRAFPGVAVPLAPAERSL